MRAAFSILVVLLLGACLAMPDGAAAPPAEDEGQAAEVAQTPRVPEAAAPQSPPSPFPPALAAEQRACAALGGALSPRGAGALWTCVRMTRDGGRPCATGADCEGLCLARSRNCAPAEPLFGCHEALDLAGRPQTVCRE